MTKSQKNISDNIREVCQDDFSLRDWVFGHRRIIGILVLITMIGAAVCLLFHWLFGVGFFGLMWILFLILLFIAALFVVVIFLKWCFDSSLDKWDGRVTSFTEYLKENLFE